MSVACWNGGVLARRVQVEIMRGDEGARLFPASSDTGEAVPVGTPLFVAATRDVSGCGSRARGCLARARTGMRDRRRCRGRTPLRSRRLNSCRLPVRVCVCACVPEKRGGGRKWGGGGSGWREGDDYWQWAGEKEATPVSFSFCQRNLGSFSLSYTSSRTSYLASPPLQSWTSQVKRPFSSPPAALFRKI